MPLDRFAGAARDLLGYSRSRKHGSGPDSEMLRQIPVAPKPSGGIGLSLQPNRKMPRRLTILDVYDNGTRVDAVPRSILNFIGATSIVDDPHGDKVDVTLGGGATAFNQSFVSQARTTNQTISTGTVTALAPDVFSQSQGFTPGTFDTSSLPSGTLTFVSFQTVAVTLVIDWPAGTYDRYIEITVANPSLSEYTKNPRLRNGETPDGDRQTLTAIVSGGNSPSATTITANVFQASGSNKAITGMFQVRAITGKLV